MQAADRHVWLCLLPVVAAHVILYPHPMVFNPVCPTSNVTHDLLQKFFKVFSPLQPVVAVASSLADLAFPRLYSPTLSHFVSIQLS